MGLHARPRLLAVVTGLSIFLNILPGTQICAAAQPDFIAPVNGPIVRRFEQPLGPYAAGHRGIDFGVGAGTPVVASASGKVTFAGPVADDGLFITIDHGLIRTSYSFLSQVDVNAGQQVR